MERKYYLRGLGIGIAVTAVIMGILTSRDKTMTDQEIIARAKELGMVENTVLSDMNEEEEPEPADTSAGQGMEPDQAGTGKESSLGVAGNTSADETPGKDGEKESPETDTEKPGGTERLQNGTEIPDSAGESQDDAEESGSGKTQEEEADGADQPQAGAQGSTDNRTDENVKGQEPANGRDNASAAAVKTITVSSGDGSHTVARKLAEAGIVSSADSYDEFLCRNGYDKKLRTGTFSIPIDASDEQIARIVTGAE